MATFEQHGHTHRLAFADPRLREWDCTVLSSAQVGRVEVVKVESKGRQNRRVRIRLR